jgi:xylan 1,4-beta-xylosidase
MARMGEHILARGADHLVTADDTGRVTVLAWAPVDHSGATRSPDRHSLSLSVPVGAPGTSSAFVLRSIVDEEQGNAWTAWSEMGRPRSPRPRELDLLREAAEPGRSHRSVPVAGGRADIDITLGRHEVTLLEITPVADETPPWWDETRLLGAAPEEGASDE